MWEFRGLDLPVWLKFAICIGCDLFDMTIGRVMFGVSLLTEGGTAVLMFALWGPLGVTALWEVLDPTEQVDGFVPTNTLIAWAAHKKAIPQS